MSNVEVLDARPDLRGGYKVEVGRGERIGRVSSEWFSRPDDARYLSLSELMASVKGRADRSRTRTVESAAVRVEASRDDAERLDLVPPGADPLEFRPSGSARSVRPLRRPSPARVSRSGLRAADLPKRRPAKPPRSGRPSWRSRRRKR